MENAKATRPQIACISALINKLGLQAQKGTLCIAASGGRTESRAELTHEEAIWLIKFLKSKDDDEISAEKMRRKIIARFHEMDYHKPGTKQIDMKAVDAWCSTRGYLHKHLNSYTRAELPKLVTQVEAVYQSYLKGF